MVQGSGKAEPISSTLQILLLVSLIFGNISLSIISYFYLERLTLVVHTIRILYVLELALIGLTYCSFYLSDKWLGKAFKAIKDADNNQVDAYVVKLQADDEPSFPDSIERELLRERMYPGWLVEAMRRQGTGGFIILASVFIYVMNIIWIIFWFNNRGAYGEMESVLAWITLFNILPLIALILTLRTVLKTKYFIEWRNKWFNSTNFE